MYSSEESTSYPRVIFYFFFPPLVRQLQHIRTHSIHHRAGDRNNAFLSVHVLSRIPHSENTRRPIGLIINPIMNAYTAFVIYLYVARTRDVRVDIVCSATRLIQSLIHVPPRRGVVARARVYTCENSFFFFGSTPYTYAFIT